MKDELIYEIPSMYRDDFRVRGYRFGSGKKALCIVGSVRGNEYQQIYTCSQVVNALKKIEESGMLIEGNEILVIPSLNPCSMNIEKRFWPTDNTDINRMFPGYSLGETTQRIAAGVFEEISQYDNGIQFASFYMPGKFSPHVRIMKTGYENVDKARQFGLPYIVLRHTKPYDTCTLNYNWQIWETDAFSLYGTSTDTLDIDSAVDMVNAVLSFMRENNYISGDYPVTRGNTSKVLYDKDLKNVRPKKSGIFISRHAVTDHVNEGEVIASIVDTCQGNVIEELIAPVSGTIFFKHDKPLVYAQTAVVKILPD